MWLDGGGWGLLGPLLHCALPCSPGISLFLLHFFTFSLSQKHMWAYSLACTSCIFTHHINGNPGNLPTSPPGTFDDRSLILQVAIPSIPCLPPVHSSRSPLWPLCALFVWTRRAHSYIQLVIMYTHHNPLFCRKPCFLCLLPSAIRCTIYW